MGTPSDEGRAGSSTHAKSGEIMSKPHKPSRRLSGTGILALSAALAMCAGLAVAPASPATSFPIGTYTAKGLAATVTFDAKGKLHVVQRGVTEVDADYTVNGDRIQLTDRSGPWACTKAGEETGTYHWKYENGALAFGKVSDRCEDRVASLTKYQWNRT